MPRRPSVAVAQRREAKMQSLEMAAIAAVQMENDEYTYGPDGKRCYDENGKITWNMNELYRRAGLPGYINDGHRSPLEENPYFREMVEYHRQRRVDPMFRAKLADPTAQWKAIGKKALDNIYEILEYSPHSLTVDENLKIIKTVLDAGELFGKEGGGDRTSSVLDSLSPEQREKVLANRVERARHSLEQAESLKLAHRAADRKAEHET